MYGSRRRVSIVSLSSPHSLLGLLDFTLSYSGYVSKPILVPALLEALNAAAAKVQKQRAALGLPGAEQDSSGVPVASTSTSVAPTMPNLGSFELELPTTRLGRLSRAGSHSSKGSASRSAGSSPSRSPDPTYRTVSDGGAPSSG